MFLSSLLSGIMCFPVVRSIVISHTLWCLNHRMVPELFDDLCCNDCLVVNVKQLSYALVPGKAEYMHCCVQLKMINNTCFIIWSLEIKIYINPCIFMFFLILYPVIFMSKAKSVNRTSQFPVPQKYDSWWTICLDIYYEIDCYSYETRSHTYHQPWDPFY